MAQTMLTIGEVLVLCMVAPGHLPGEPFDLVSELSTDNYNRSEPGAMRNPSSLMPHAMTLCDKGMLSTSDGSTFALTEYGESVWKVLKPQHRKSREASGIGRQG